MLAFPQDPETASYVGTPNVFVSHAWQYNFLELLDALGEFVGAPKQELAGLLDDEYHDSLFDTIDTDLDSARQRTEIFFWFDCFVIDEHATQSLTQEWWKTTFTECIARIGHTVMVLSPWNAPIPLTRAWCLWEIYSTVKTAKA